MKTHAERIHTLQACLTNAEESNLYSKQVNDAINAFGNAGTITDAVKFMEEHSQTNFEHVLYRQIEDEGRSYRNFTNSLSRVPSAIIADVDFI